MLPILTQKKRRRQQLQEPEIRRDTMKPDAYQGVKASYDHNMLVIMQEHVTVLRKLGKVPEVQALKQRASALSGSR